MKFKHLHGKIKAVRQRLGIRQKDFVIAVSEKLNRNLPLSPGLVSQWESNLENNRTTPTAPQLVAIIKLTERPWHTALWFMDDEVHSGRGAVYYQDGSKMLEPEWSEDVEAMQEAFQIEQEVQYNALPNPELVEWETNPEKIYGLQKILHAAQIRKHIDRMSKSLETEKAAIEQGHKAVLTQYAQPKSVCVSATVSGVSAKATVSSLVVQRPRNVGDLVEFPVKKFVTAPEGDMLRGQGELTEADDYSKRRDAFYGALEYSLAEDHGYLDTHLGLNVKKSIGDIGQHINYFLHGAAIQFLPIIQSSSLTLIKLKIKEKMSELFLLEKIQNRTSQKMILVYTHERNLSFDKLQETLRETINSASLLGVMVRFASGPEGCAKEIATFIDDITTV